MKKNRENTLHEALTQGDPLLFKGISHTDLHCHSLESAPFNKCKKLNLKMKPAPNKFASFQAFNNYLRENIAPAVTNIDSVRHLVRAAFERLINEGVRYTEMSFDLTVPEFLGVSLEEYIELISEETERVSQQLGVLPEAGLDREVDPKKTIQLLRQSIRKFVFLGVDLYGDESKRPIDEFVPIYRLAGEHGLKLKAHIGEFGTADQIKQAIEKLELEAIQHGNQAILSSEVVELIKRKNIVLNMAPQSNLALGVVDSLQNHPIKRLLDESVMVTVNTDDFTVFNKSVAEQLIELYESGVCSEDDIEKLIENGLKQVQYE